jgi:hypothetical protein
MRHDLKTIVDAPTPNVASTLTYADLARFILEQVEDDTFLGKAVGVYTDTIGQF